MVAIIVGWNFELKHPQIGDCSYAFKDVVMVHDDMIEYMEQHVGVEDKINAHFLMSVNLTTPECGYLRSNKAFKHVKSIHNDCSSFDYIIISSVEYNAGLETMARDECNFAMIKEFSKGPAWIKLYAKP